MTHLSFNSISEISNKIQQKEISPVELVKTTLQNIKRVNPQLNAYREIYDEDALAQAKQLEDELMKGKVRGPLHGVPISLKDLIEVEGKATTGGSKVLENWRTDKNATVVNRLKEAGAVITGKTNLHEFGMGATSENNHFGAVHNPFNLEKIPGGSSGGSAAEVAAGLSFGSIGTDAAGSVRLPAAFCGIVGLKPTFGRVSRYGTVPGSWAFDHLGPITRNVEDAGILYKTIAGYDQHDDSSSKKEVTFTNIDRQDLNGVTVGINRNYFFDGVDHQVEKLMENTITTLKRLGAKIVEINIEQINDALQSFKTIAQSELFAFHKPIWEKNNNLYGEDINFRFNYAKELSATDYLNAQRFRKRFISHVVEVMKDIDILISPTNSQAPFTIGLREPEDNMNNIYTLGKTPLINFIGFPAINIPLGMLEGNLPSGLQMIAKPFEEDKLCQIAKVYESTHDTGHWTSKLIKKFHTVS